MKILFTLYFLILLSCHQQSGKAQTKGSEPDTLALFKEYVKMFREIKADEYPFITDPLYVSFKPEQQLD